MPATSAELELLYRERYARFRDVLAGVVGSHETAREVVQEAFARALRDRKKFRGEGSLESWVWRIALNQAFRARRDLKQRWDDDVEGAVEDSHSDRDVRAAVSALPPRRRLIVFLRYYADLSYEEIAAVCGVSEGTVAATLAQARDELVEHLTPEGALR
jgi:RNA polymerase sigma-70 factor (ECF subfamily)